MSDNPTVGQGQREGGAFPPPLPSSPEVAGQNDVQVGEVGEPGVAAGHASTNTGPEVGAGATQQSAGHGLERPPDAQQSAGHGLERPPDAQQPAGHGLERPPDAQQHASASESAAQAGQPAARGGESGGQSASHSCSHGSETIQRPGGFGRRPGEETSESGSAGQQAHVTFEHAATECG